MTILLLKNNFKLPTPTVFSKK